MKIRKKPGSGFTLIEFLLVIVLFGTILSVILPRAQRAAREAKFSMVRQYAAEMASYSIQYAQNQTAAQREDSPYTTRDFLMGEVDPAVAGLKSPSLVNSYTGSDHYNGVERLAPPEKLPTNPFNEVSYFSKVNDDQEETPSPKPGLLYMATAQDPLSNGAYRNFYFIYTGFPGAFSGGKGVWYGQMDHKSADSIRRGIFITRLPDSSPQTVARR